jgi:hypothetical protein
MLVAVTAFEWAETPKGGEMGSDAHDASESATQTEPEKLTVYPRHTGRQQTPTLHAATAPAEATGSRLPLQPGPQAEPVQPASAGFQVEFVGSTSGVVPVQLAQAVQPASADFTFMGSASDSCGGARRPAPARRPGGGQRGRGQRLRGGKPGQGLGHAFS